MTFTPRKKFGIFLILLIFILSLFAWKSFFVATVALGPERFLLPTLWFSLLLSFFFVGAAVWSDTWSRVIGSLVFYVPGFLFIHSWLFSIVLLIAAALSLSAMRQIREDIDERILFHFFKSARVGQFFLMLSLSLALGSGYYELVKNSSWDDLVPRFEIGQGSASFIIRIASHFSPDFKVAVDEDLTVDQYLSNMQGDAGNEMFEKNQPKSGSLSVEEGFPSLPGFKEFIEKNFEAGTGGSFSLRDAYLRSGREQISTLVGRPVLGNEKIASVFAMALQRKMSALLSGQELSKRLPPKGLPLFLSVLLFISILSLSSILGPLWILFGLFLFWIAKKLRFIAFGRVSREQEVLTE